MTRYLTNKVNLYLRRSIRNWIYFCSRHWNTLRKFQCFCAYWKCWVISPVGTYPQYSQFTTFGAYTFTQIENTPLVAKLFKLAKDVCHLVVAPNIQAGIGTCDLSTVKYILLVLVLKLLLINSDSII